MLKMMAVLKRFVYTVVLLILIGAGLFFVPDHIGDDGGETVRRAGFSVVDSTQIELRTATIGSMGDYLIHEPILDAAYLSGDRYDFSGIFTHIKPYIEDLDYGVINFEGTISSAESGFSGYPRFRLPVAALDAVVGAGFDMVLGANNHMADGGSVGIMNTIGAFEASGLDFIGLRDSLAEDRYLVQEIDGIKIGLTNWTYGAVYDDGRVALNGIGLNVSSSGLVNVFDYTKLDAFYKEQEALIENMRSDGAEAIVYFLHWGSEYHIQESSLQRAIAQRLCDLGVDVIVGGHPHVLQPISVLESSISDNKTVCLYSMGNGVSNQRAERMDLSTGHTEDGLLFSFTFTKFGDEPAVLSDVSFLPTWTHLFYREGKRVYEIVPLDDSVGWGHLFSSSAELRRADGSFMRTHAILDRGFEELMNSF